MVFIVKITLKSVNCKGFLIIELIVALGLLAILILVISEYQLQVQLYRQAAKQLYSATSKCEDLIESLWAGVNLPINQVIISDEFKIDISSVPGPNQAFKYVQVSASWVSALKRPQKIRFDVICL